LKTRLLVGIVITRSNEEWELGILLHFGKELFNKYDRVASRIQLEKILNFDSQLTTVRKTFDL